jgi:hypothetical protein
MKQIFAFVLSLAINVAALGTFQNIGSDDAPRGEVYITELGTSTAPAQVAALEGHAG